MLKKTITGLKRFQHAFWALVLVLTLGSCSENVGLFDGYYSIHGTELDSCQFPYMTVSLHFDEAQYDSVVGRMSFSDSYSYGYGSEYIEYKISYPQFENRFKCTARLTESMGGEYVSEVGIEYDSLANYYRFYFGEMPILGLSNDTISVYAEIDRVTLAPVYDGVYPSRYFGRWVADYMWAFGLFAIIMCIPALYYGLLLRHLLMTAAMAFTFYNDYMVFLPCMFAYYLCYPMIYIRGIKPAAVLTIYTWVTVVAFCYSLYCIYLYDTFGSAFLYAFFWMFTSVVFSTIFMGDNEKRCPKCGRFTKKVALGDEYFNRPKILNKIGSLDFNGVSNSLDAFFTKKGYDKSVFCFWCEAEIDNK